MLISKFAGLPERSDFILKTFENIQDQTCLRSLLKGESEICDPLLSSFFQFSTISISSETIITIISHLLDQRKFKLISQALKYSQIHQISFPDTLIIKLIETNEASLFPLLVEFSNNSKTIQEHVQNIVKIPTIEKVLPNAIFDLNLFAIYLSPSQIIYKSDPRRILPYHLGLFQLSDETYNSLIRSLVSLDIDSPNDAFRIYRMIYIILKRKSALPDQLFQEVLTFSIESLNSEYSFIFNDLAKILSYLAKINSKAFPNISISKTKTPILLTYSHLFSDGINLSSSLLLQNIKELFVSQIPSRKLIALDCLTLFLSPSASQQAFKAFVDFSSFLIKNGNRSEKMIKLISHLIHHPKINEIKKNFFPDVIQFLCFPSTSSSFPIGLNVLSETFQYLDSSFPALNRYVSSIIFFSQIPEVVITLDKYYRWIRSLRSETSKINIDMQQKHFFDILQTFEIHPNILSATILSQLVYQQNEENIKNFINKAFSLSKQYSLFILILFSKLFKAEGNESKQKFLDILSISEVSDENKFILKAVSSLNEQSPIEATSFFILNENQTTQ